MREPTVFPRPILKRRRYVLENVRWNRGKEPELHASGKAEPQTRPGMPARANPAVFRGTRVPSRKLECRSFCELRFFVPRQRRQTPVPMEYGIQLFAPRSRPKCNVDR